jgi:hypothetical protein
MITQFNKCKIRKFKKKGDKLTMILEITGKDIEEAKALLGKRILISPYYEDNFERLQKEANLPSQKRITEM